jgi:hypothetical protein
VATERVDLISQAIVAVATGVLVLHTARQHMGSRSVG